MSLLLLFQLHVILPPTEVVNSFSSIIETNFIFVGRVQNTFNFNSPIQSNFVFESGII